MLPLKVIVKFGFGRPVVKMLVLAILRGGRRSSA